MYRLDVEFYAAPDMAFRYALHDLPMCCNRATEDLIQLDLRQLESKLASIFLRRYVISSVATTLWVFYIV